MEKSRKTGLARILNPFTDLFGLTIGAALATLIFLTALIGFAIYWFIHLTPPSTLTITSGPPGTSFHTNALRYQSILASNGIHLKILTSEGSLENLDRLSDPRVDVDIGFVQGGVTNAAGTKHLMSLGSLSYQPMLIFYRSTNAVSILSEFKGKRICIGPVGSGTRTLALTLLSMNGIEPGGSTTLSEQETEQAAKALEDGTMDAVFMMGDSASPQLMKHLLLAPGVRIYDFTQADAYARRVSYLNKLELPKGCLDFGKNIPPQNVYVVGPTVELVARKKLHPALGDLLLEAAREVHGKPGLLRRKGEFPAPLEHEIVLSPEALRYYKSGKTFLYRQLPFWMASLVNRILVVFVPFVVLLIPGLKVIPTLMQLGTKLRIYRWYRALLALERDVAMEGDKISPERHLERLNEIERAVNSMKIPVSFANQFYSLRGDINFVRMRLLKDREQLVPRKG
jgi:TRAP-type uncharacterized transport system substrate-binding protein